MNKINKFFFIFMTLVVCLLGWIDLKTGHELNFFVFYFIPIGIIAWQKGFLATLVFSFFCALIWYAADIGSGHTYSNQLFSVWNTLIRLSSFIAIGWAFSRIHDLVNVEHEKSTELSKTLARLHVLEGCLPICAVCKKIRDNQGNWQPMESYITNHSSASFSHGYCPACGKKALEDAGLA